MKDNTVTINGVIVPSIYDDGWFENYIDKGLITPLSRVEKQLKEADAKKPLNVRINSGGGSVFSGHEMLNAIVDWRNENKQVVNVEIGAMAASAASTIAVMLGPVRAHENTLFMFHGASSYAEGQRGEMLDTAELLDQINAQVAMKLVNSYGMDPDQVAEWFSDGRMGWVGAQDAKAYGLVDIVIPAEADAIEFDADNIAAMTKNGIDIAAMLEIETQHGEEDMKAILDKVRAMIGLESEDPTEIEQALEAYQVKQKEAVDTAYDEGLHANVAEKVAEIESDCKARVEEADGKVTAAEELKAKAETDTAEMKSKLEKAEARLQVLDKGLKDGDGGRPEFSSFWEVVDAFIEEGFSKERAMLKAQREYNDLHQEMLKQGK